MELKISGSSFAFTPVWWQNFVNHLKVEDNSSWTDKEWDQYLNEKLSKYTATMIQEEDKDGELDIVGLRFEDPKYVTLFLLEYS